MDNSNVVVSLELKNMHPVGQELKILYIIYNFHAIESDYLSLHSTQYLTVFVQQHPHLHMQQQIMQIQYPRRG